MKRRLSVALSLFGAAAALLVIGMTSRGTPTVEAIASCVPHQNSSEELEFLSQLAAWRATSGKTPSDFKRSESLNAAAHGYARFLADTSGAAGHYADGSNWTARASACGFHGAGGEGLAVVESSASLSVGPGEALSIMTSHAGSGIYVTHGDPFVCVGVGKAANASGTKVAWVVLLMQHSGPVATCPDETTSIGGNPTASPSASTIPTSTFTPTNTATPTQTATPTATATPTSTFDATLDLVPGQWNLVTLPAGDMASVMARALGCYEAVYRQAENGSWLRFAPDVPAYASNLLSSDGGAYWVMGSSEDCGEIDL